MQIRAAKFTAEKKLMYLYQELRPMAMGMDSSSLLMGNAKPPACLKIIPSIFAAIGQEDAIFFCLA